MLSNKTELSVTNLLCFKGPFSGLREFLATDYSLITSKKTFQFTVKALFINKIFKILFWLFWPCRKMV